MTRSRLLVLSAAIALAIAAALHFRSASAPETPPAAPPAEIGRADPDSRPPEPPPAPDAAEQALPVIPPSELADRRDLGTGESDGVLATLPTRIQYPLQEKYRDQVWSDVPHELVAAHDGLEEQEGEGARRLFIALVEPGLSDEQIERLVRDFRARHREAEVLRIRVFDDREAAGRPSWTDGGAALREHLVADLYREPGRERFVVRGREVNP